jgi:hypothetical protein
MLELANLRLEIPAEERRLIAIQLRTLEESSLRVPELFHPFESSLVRRQALSHENAEQLQRINSHLRSRISQAVWDLGLPRTNQDPRQELAWVAARMAESIEGLLHVGNQSGTSSPLGAYLTQLAGDLQGIVDAIGRVAGKSGLNTAAVR